MIALLGLAFPFHLRLGADLAVHGFGRSLPRLCPGIATGDRLTDHVTTLAGGPVTAELLVPGRNALLLRATAADVPLRCQVVPLEPLGGDGVVLLVTPWLAGPDDFARSGLRLGDFAPHDPTPDYAFSSQAQHAALTDARRLAERLSALEATRRHEALHDPLTGVGNRRWFTGRLADALDGTALVLVDVDRFKEINDAYGAAAGDRVLIEVVARLRTLCPAGAAVARIGGDEFAVLLDGPDADAASTRIGQGVVDAMAEPVAWGGRRIPVSVSVGTAPPGAPAELTRNADVALWTAKRSACGAVRFDPRQHASLLHRLELRDRLAQDVAAGAVHVVYQPIVRLDTGRVHGFEALARWKDRVVGSVSPDVFIPLAEEAGLIGDLGLSVLTKAAAQAAAWRARYPDADLRMSVNLAPRQLEAPDLAERLHAVVAAAGVPPHALQLELTESAFTRHVFGARQLDALRELGYPLAIDDFGAAESTLARLHAVPASTLKVDRAFLTQLDAAPERTARLLGAVLTIADVFGMTTVAEGVETAAHRDLVREAGCRYGQGWFWSKALEPEDADAYLVAELATPPQATGSPATDAPALPPQRRRGRRAAAS